MDAIVVPGVSKGQFLEDDEACDNLERKISVQSGDFGDQGKRRLEKDYEGRKRWEG